MITTTVGDIIDGWRCSEDEDYCVYVLRDGDYVLYVGRSINPTIRVLAHISGPKRSIVGREIADNPDVSRDWEIDFYTLEDCRPFIPIIYRRFDSRTAEAVMIDGLKPYLNTQGIDTAINIYAPTDFSITMRKVDMPEEERKRRLALAYDPLMEVYDRLLELAKEVPADKDEKQQRDK